MTVSKKVRLQDLVIELTRRCNMNCSHCLRGDAENCNIDTKYIDALLNKVSYISTITFTGGEPSLVPELIQYTIDKAKDLNIAIGSFYIVTNAKHVSNEFLIAVMNLYLYCDDNEMSQLDISNDSYHKDSFDSNDELLINYEKLSILRFTRKREVNNGNSYDRNLISQGNAEMNYSCEKFIEISGYYFLDDYLSGLIYLNCYGNIYSSCDLSYETQDNNNILKVGNITDKRFNFKNNCNIFNNLLEKTGSHLDDIINYKIQNVA